MDASNEVRRIFEETGALMKGHFILRSGLRSACYLQSARVCEDLAQVKRLAGLLLRKLSGWEFDTVAALAMGGLVIGQEVARQTRKRYIFMEKEKGKLALRRGFTLFPGERILIVEDVITKGGRAAEALEIIRAAGGKAVGVALLVDRGGGKVRFEVPHAALLEMTFPVYPPEALPDDLKAIPPVKPGS